MNITDLSALAQADRRDYMLLIFTPEGQDWQLTPGAFGKEGCGPV